MGATSETEIANLALTRIGHGLISALSENSTAAQVCNLHYPRTRDAMLRAHPWNFAVRRATLARSSTTPNHEFNYYHVLPADCLKVLRTHWEADGSVGTSIYGFPGQMGYAAQIAPYRIESVSGVGKCLACNEDTVKIEYIAQITDTAQFDDLFVDCLAARLAAEIAMRLTDNQSAARTMWDMAAAKLAEARTADSQEGTPREAVDLSGWIAARV